MALGVRSNGRWRGPVLASGAQHFPGEATVARLEENARTDLPSSFRNVSLGGFVLAVPWYGVGAVRRCEFSTGAFVEPVQVWDEPRLLRFSVTQTPSPMEELTPYHHIETPHLNG
jgi:hypothetical protein